MNKTIRLNDQNEIPLIGFGTYKANGEEGVKTVQEALATGYRLIDTATIYKNEKEVGLGIKKSDIPRNEVILTTKVWRENMSYKNTKRALDASLKALDMEYIDLYLIHWPANAKNYTNWESINAEVWKSMEELQREGYIRSIGVSNFLVQHLQALFHTAHIKPAINQIEFHPGYWQRETYEFCKKNDIGIEAWSPLARGKVFEEKQIVSLAVKYGKTVSQIILRWIVQHEVIPIPKTVSSQRMKENLDIFDFELSESEMTEIDAIPEMGFSGEHPNHWPDKI